LVKPNYAFAKRQKELAKQAKQEEKRKKKAEANEVPPVEEGAEPLAPDAEKAPS
jgi:hypothetical protein